MSQGQSMMYRQDAGVRNERSIGQQLSGLATSGLAEVNVGALANAFLEEPPVWKAARMVSGAACTYHGYKRNESIGWALWWSFAGALFPLFTPIVAVAQGFGERKR